MRFESSDAALFVTKDHQLLAEQLHLLRQILKLVRGAHRLPIPAQQFTHRASLLDAGQLIVWWRCLPSVGRFSSLPPMLPGGPACRLWSAPDDRERARFPRGAAPRRGF